MKLDNNMIVVRFRRDIDKVPYEADHVYWFTPSQEAARLLRHTARLRRIRAQARGLEAEVEAALRKAARLRRDVVEYMTENDAGRARAMHDNNIGLAPLVNDLGDGRLFHGDRAAGPLGAPQAGLVPPLVDPLVDPPLAIHEDDRVFHGDRAAGPLGAPQAGLVPPLVVPPRDPPLDHPHDQHVDQHVHAPPLPLLAPLPNVQEPSMDVSETAGAPSADGELGEMGKWKFHAAARAAKICMPACLHGLFTRRCAHGTPSRQEIASTMWWIDPERSVNVHTGDGAAAPPTRGQPSKRTWRFMFSLPCIWVCAAPVERIMPIFQNAELGRETDAFNEAKLQVEVNGGQ
eukprot:TRINITY_DN5466_c0_g2_i1.p2 TRINITY_DN5466_c0_g2~~TRINITY_DN5466_c0_g2_i1.p2  ORF type:complete len:365 (-),score=71.55 TRINITY_DN5466_c0_g2_i1:586-1623(-)